MQDELKRTLELNATFSMNTSALYSNTPIHDRSTHDSSTLSNPEFQTISQVSATQVGSSASKTIAHAASMRNPLATYRSMPVGYQAHCHDLNRATESLVHSGQERLNERSILAQAVSPAAPSLSHLLPVISQDSEFESFLDDRQLANQCELQRTVSEPPSCERSRDARFVSQFGFLVNYYNLSLINTAKPLLRHQFGNPTAFQQSMLTSSALVGASIGQLILGPLSDRIGRKNSSMLSAGITLIGSAAFSLAEPVGSNRSSIYSTLSLARFFVGVGSGGDLPILSSITAENVQSTASSEALIRNSLMIMAGNALAQAVYAALIPVVSEDKAWRIPAVLGALASGTMLLSRCLLLREETPSASDASEQSKPPVDVFQALSTLWKPILGTSLSWMMYDFIDFAMGTSCADILGSATHPEQGALLSTIVAGIMLAGPMIAMHLIEPDRLGRHGLQLVGFVGLAMCHLALAGCAAANLWQDDMNSDGIREVSSKTVASYGAFLLLYGAQQLFDASAAGIGIYVVPSEIFPSEIRSTCMGIASAAGKLGAFLGTATMPFMRQNLGLPKVFAITGMAGALGALTTMGLIPTYGPETLSELKRVYREKGAEGVLNLLYPDPSRFDSENELPMSEQGYRTDLSA